MGTANSNPEVVKQGRKALLRIICINIKTAMETLIFKSRCNSPSKPCDCTMLGALVKGMASRGLDHWFSRRFEGLEDSITDCVSKFSSLLSEIRLATVETASALSHRKCGPWELEDEQYGDAGMATILSRLVSEYAGHLKTQAEKSGLNPDLSGAT